MPQNPIQRAAALLLGLQGTLVKAHGSSDARAITNAIGLARKLAERQVPLQIAEQMEKFMELSGGDPDDVPETRARKIWRAFRERLRGQARDGASEEVKIEEPGAPGSEEGDNG